MATYEIRKNGKTATVEQIVVREVLRDGCLWAERVTEKVEKPLYDLCKDGVKISSDLVDAKLDETLSGTKYVKMRGYYKDKVVERNVNPTEVALECVRLFSEVE